MERFFNWLLGGMAVGVAVHALAPDRRGTAEAEATPPGTTLGPIETATSTAPVTTTLVKDETTTTTVPVPSAEPAAPPADEKPSNRIVDTAERIYTNERVQTAKSFTAELLDELRRDHMSLIAASLSYYAMLAIFPALIATISIYALVLDPDTLAETIESFTTVFPEDIVSIIERQLNEIVSASSSGLTLSAVISIILTLWTASAGTKSLIRGLNIAYDIEEHRPYLLQRAIAYGFTIGLIIFVTTSAALVSFVPEWLGAAEAAKRAIEILRWPGLMIVVILGLGLLYRFGPNRPAQRSHWLSPGAFVAAVLWIIATLGFSYYVTNLGEGNFNATYGTLSGVIVLLLWFFISGYVILLGAEINAVVEHRRLRARRGLGR